MAHSFPMNAPLAETGNIGDGLLSTAEDVTVKENTRN
jgi:hypothetical protein